jgi:hypothetical protein
MIAGAAIGAAAARHGDSNEAAPEEYETASAPAPADPVEELKKLSELHASGELTDEEFATAKARILGT